MSKYPSDFVTPRVYNQLERVKNIVDLSRIVRAFNSRLGDCLRRGSDDLPDSIYKKYDHKIHKTYDQELCDVFTGDKTTTMEKLKTMLEDMGHIAKKLIKQHGLGVPDRNSQAFLTDYQMMKDYFEGTLKDLDTYAAKEHSKGNYPLPEQF